MLPLAEPLRALREEVRQGPTCVAERGRTFRVYNPRGMPREPNRGNAMPTADKSVSFYFFDIDDNLFFLPTSIYLWNAEAQLEQAVTSGVYARIQSELGRAGEWLAWSKRDETFRDFRDSPDIPTEEQPFLRDLQAATSGTAPWQGPSWSLLVRTARRQRPIAMVTARGHEPSTIEAGLQKLVEMGYLPAVPPIVGIYAVTNPGVRAMLGAEDPAMTVPSIKKLAIKHAVDAALTQYGSSPPHRFGMSDDDPNNVVLAISAMRDCKLKYPDKRFFVINTNHEEFVKVEIFPMTHPVTADVTGAHLLREDGPPVEHPSGDGEGHREGPRPAIFGGSALVYVSEMNRAIAFYTEVLGFKLRAQAGGDGAEIEAGNGLVISLQPASPPDTPAPGTAGAINIKLTVSRPLEEIVAVLSARGVSFNGPILDHEGVRVTSLSDPDDNGLLLAEGLHRSDPA
jgi:catechol 2,3-dioxygenase-like lactoylglutathione lyase family enzyme